MNLMDIPVGAIPDHGDDKSPVPASPAPAYR